MEPESSILIREAEPSDIPGILVIYNDAILNTTAVYHYDPFSQEAMERWFAEKRKAGHPVLVAINGSMLSGFATYTQFRPWAGYRFTMESSVYIHPNYRGKGIAARLMQELISSAMGTEIHSIIAGIDAENATSIRLHEKLGFRQAGRLEQAGIKFGQWLDLVFYQLIL